MIKKGSLSAEEPISQVLIDKDCENVMARDCHKLKSAKSESSSLKGHLSESETDYYLNFQDAKLLTLENWHHFSSLCSGSVQGDVSAELDCVMVEEKADSDEIVFLL